MNDLKVGHRLIEAGQNGSCFRFHYRLVRVWSREPANCLHRLPEGKQNQLDAVFYLAAKQVLSAMPLDGTELWEHTFVAW